VAQNSATIKNKKNRRQRRDGWVKCTIELDGCIQPAAVLLG